MRDRGSVVIIEKQKVLLIQRIRGHTTYYVFPGGGIEKGETPEVAAKREAFEELGVNVKVNDCFAIVDFIGKQYFFLSEIISGTIGTGQGEEYENMNSDRGTYLPMWMDIELLSTMDVRPNIIALKVQTLFSNQMKNLK